MSKIKKIISVSALSLLILALVTLLIFVSLFVFVRMNISYEADDALFVGSQYGGTRFFAYDGHGDAVEVDMLTQNGVKKVFYPIDEISDYLKVGFVAMEDREFYTHGGVNYRRTFAALLNYFTRFRSVYGASTITQQVVKNISGDSEVTLRRKLSEIIRAHHMEKMHTKEEILELYLNIVPLSENMAGVGMGARRYFGKEPSELTVAEAATIIGITNSPSKYNPYRHYDDCLKKRNRVLYAMREVGAIDEEEYLAAREAPINLKSGNTEYGYGRSWFTETVMADVEAALMKKYGISHSVANLLLMRGGYEIYTTQNIEMQRLLDGYFSDSDNFPSAVENGLNYAMAICDSEGGGLLAIYGSAGEKKGSRLLNYATANVTPGSVLKPLALYAPLIDAKRINWATLFEDSPTSVKRKDGKYVLYPRNYPDAYEGKIPIHTALERSKNTVAVKLYDMLGGENIYYSLKNDFGFDSLVRNVYNKKGEKVSDVGPAPLALGQLSYGVALRRLTAAYTVFPSDGVYHGDRSYTEVYNSRGELILENKPEPKRIFRAESARIMNKLLERVTEVGTARSIKLNSIVDTAGKTGTSGSDLDRLFIGYTPYVTAGIWCGYRERSSPVGNLSPSHLEIWDSVMIGIHEYILKSNESPRGFSTQGIQYLPYRLFEDSEEEYGYFEYDNAPSGELMLVPAAIVSDGGVERKRRFLRISDIIS